MSAKLSDTLWNLAWLSGLLFFVSVYYYKSGLDCFSLAAHTLAPFGTEWKGLRIDDEVLEAPGVPEVVILHILWVPFMIAIAAVHTVLGAAMGAIVIGFPMTKVHITLLPYVLRPLHKQELFWCCHCCP